MRTSIGEENAQGQLDRPLKAIRRGLGCWALVAVGWLNYLEKMAELLLMIDIHGFNSSIAVFDSEGSQHDSSIVSARAETGRDNQSRSSSRHNVIARPSGLPTIRPL